MIKKSHIIKYVLFALFLMPIIYVFASEKWSFDLILSLSGLISILLFSCQIFLGIPEVSRLFSIDRIGLIRIHIFLGILAVFAILIHPISFLYSYNTKLSSIFLLNFSSFFGTALSLGKISFLVFILVWVSSVIIKSKIPYKNWKLFHLSTYPIVIFAFIHAYILGTYINENQIIRYWFLMLFFAVIVSILYRIISILFLEKSYLISKKVEISSGVFLYTLIPKNKPVFVRPGQFVYLSLDYYNLSHPFTVLNSNASGEIQICVKNFGDFTKRLSLRGINTKVKISNSYGVFLENPNSNRVICIAGGIGITPFLYYVEKANKDITLHYFTKNMATALFRDRLDKSLKSEYKEYFSEEERILPKDLVQGIPSEDITNAEFYLCGPSSLVEDIIKELKSKGVEKNRIFTEQFSF